MIICLYVDDLLIRGDWESQTFTIEHLKSKFSVSTEGNVKRYLGINMTTNDEYWKLDQYDNITSERMMMWISKIQWLFTEE